MKVLVTGANGQVGQALKSCVPGDVHVVAASRTECDLGNPGSIRRVLAEHLPDVVINTAAYTAVDRAESEESQAMSINAVGVGVLAEELQKQGGRLIHISTDFVFDGNISRAYRPNDLPHPLSSYGRSKAAGEVAAGTDALIVRTSWVYAAAGTNFVRTMLRLMRERDEISVVADQIGCPTWAENLAKVLWKLAALNKKGILHHRDAGVASWYDFAGAIQEEALSIGLLNKQIRIIPIRTDQYPTPAIRPAFCLLDDSTTRNLLGDINPHWRESLRKMLNQEMKNSQK